MPILANLIAGGAGLLGAGISAFGADRRVSVPELPQIDSQAAGFEAELAQVDVFGTALRASQFNTETGIPSAIEATGAINENTLNDLENALERLFGGGERLETLRTLAADNAAANLRGELTAGTRGQIGRAAVSSGISELGGGAVDFANAGFIGQTSEQLAVQGSNQFQSLYALYASSFPLTTTQDILNFTGITPGQAIQGELANAQLFQRNQELQLSQLQGVDSFNVTQQGNQFNRDLTANTAASQNPQRAALTTGIGAAVGNFGANVAAGIRSRTTPTTGGFGSRGAS